MKKPFKEIINFLIMLYVLQLFCVIVILMFDIAGHYDTNDKGLFKCKQQIYNNLIPLYPVYASSFKYWNNLPNKCN